MYAVEKIVQYSAAGLRDTSRKRILRKQKLHNAIYAYKLDHWLAGAEFVVVGIKLLLNTFVATSYISM